MPFLKQSTAAILKLGPFVDDTDFKTAETGLTIAQADIQISKNGGAFGQTSAASPTTTHDADGWYPIPLTITDTNTVGQLQVQVLMAGALPVWSAVYDVLPANVYDSLVANVDLLQIDVNQWKGATAPAMSGDAYARLGSPSQGSVVADLALVASNIQGWIAAVSAFVDTEVAAILDAVDTEVAAIKAKTDNLPASPADEATLGTIAGYIDTEVAAILTAVDTEVAAIKAVVDKLNTAVELDGAVYRFTTNALEQAPSGGGGGSGSGDTEVSSATLDVDGDNMLYQASGVGVEGGIVRAYLKSAYDAGTYTVLAEVQTAVDGSWGPMLLDAGATYTIVFYKPGVYAPSTTEVTI